jgi:transcription initiation factor TFIIIB Brf1 subunit/transcription initiation factor TFIIB
MLDFHLFDQALEIYEKNALPEADINKDLSCEHNIISDFGGVVVCSECGQELSKSVTHNKEWRYYGQVDTRRTTDPNRVHARRNDERNINKDVENMGFSDKIVSVANDIYQQVTNGQIYRGNSRKSIVFACIFHSYKLSGKPHTLDSLIKTFDLSRKIGLRGLKHVNINASKDSEIHTTYITPVNLLEDLLNKFNATQTQKNEVIALYEKLKNKSSKLNRSRPQSVASGITYYWICKKGINISLKDFAKKAELSELTIVKISKEVSRVLEAVEEKERLKEENICYINS